MPDPELDAAILDVLTKSNKWMTPAEMTAVMIERFPNKWRGISRVQSARTRVAKSMRILYEDGKLMRMTGLDNHIRYRR